MVMIASVMSVILVIAKMDNHAHADDNDDRSVDDACQEEDNGCCHSYWHSRSTGWDRLKPEAARVEVMTNFNSSWSGFVISFSFPVLFWIAGPLGARWEEKLKPH